MFLKAPKAFIVLLSKLQSIIKQKQIIELPIFMKTAPTKKILVPPSAALYSSGYETFLEF